MATACINEVEDFVTCGVCLCEYDEEIRKPKFLPCSHTVCFLCLQEIRRGDTITCPFCRKTISKDSRKEVEWILPNNTYALQMLKLNKQVPSSAASSTVMQNKTTAELLKFKDDLVKMRDAGFNKLALAIEKRKEVQEQVSLVMKCLKVAEEEVTKFQDENNLCLVEMISILEANATSGSSSTKPEKDLILNDLMSMVEGATSGDTIETLKQKMTKSVEIYERKLTEATEIAENTNSKTKIRVHLTDENGIPIPTCSELRFQPMAQGSNGPQVLRDSILLSHTTVASLKRKTNLKPEQPEASASAVTNSFLLEIPPPVQSNTGFFGNPGMHSGVLMVSTSTQKIDKKIKKLPKEKDSKLTETVSVAKGNPPKKPVVKTAIPASVPTGNFVLSDASVFILRIFQSGQPKGEVHIRPYISRATKHFLKKLGEFCYKSPKNFNSTVDKALSNVCVLLSMKNQQFQPVTSDITNFSVESANDCGDVGIVSINALGNKVTGWNFVFILNENENVKISYVKKRENLPEEVSNCCELIGRVVHRNMLQSMIQFSRVSRAERPSYTFTLESK